MEQSTRQFYDSSKKYLKRLQVTEENLSRLYQEVAESVLASSIDNFCNKGVRVLDIGCGPGFLSHYLAREGYEVTGVDFSFQFIKAAKSSWGSAPNLNFLKTDVTNLPFEDSSFDAVVANYTIEHILDVEKALQKMARVLKPTGVMFLTFPNLLSPLRPLKRFFALKHQEKYGVETGDTRLQSLVIFGRNVSLIVKKKFSSKVVFNYRKPDLEHADEYFEQGFGADYDSVYLANPIDLKKCLRRSGFTILQCSSAMKRQGLLGRTLERMPSVLISPILLVARKGKK